MSASNFEQRRVQFVAFWGGIALSQLVLTFTLVSGAAIEPAVSGSVAALTLGFAAITAFWDDVWHRIDALTAGGGRQ